MSGIEDIEDWDSDEEKKAVEEDGSDDGMLGDIEGEVDEDGSDDFEVKSQVEGPANQQVTSGPKPTFTSRGFHVSPDTNRTPRHSGTLASSSSYRDSSIPNTPLSSTSFSPSRFENSPTISPGIRSLSITPRNIARTRISSSATPTAIISRQLDTTTMAANEPTDFTEMDDEDDWGGGAVLQWDGVDMTGDSASSVAPGDAGLETDDLEEEEEEWGKEGGMEFGWNGDGGIDEDDIREDREGKIIGIEDYEEDEEMEEPEEEEEEEVEERIENRRNKSPDLPKEETIADLVARGMPDYTTWDLLKLQKLCKSYGYKTGTQRSPLEKIATSCWRAIHALSEPDPAPIKSKSTTRTTRPTVKAPTKSRRKSISSDEEPLSKKKAPPKGKGKAVAKSRQVSISSDDVPLSAKKPPAKSKAKGKGKEKAVEVELAPIEERFAAMVKGDDVLYLRILQYEPLFFDELVSKATEAGISDKGMKIALKKFLDFEGITFYTEDPTGPRRSRH